MKRLLLCAVSLFAIFAVEAQSIIVVDSEKIFKSMPEYNAAISNIESLTKRCQEDVERRFAEVEQLFNLYSLGRASYSEKKRSETEALILAKEKEATEFQEECFAEDGTIMKERISLITPIQKRVFNTIDTYAKSNNIDLVVDKSANPSILYSGGALDRTDAIIEILKK